VPATNRDARAAPPKDGSGAGGSDLRPISRKFTKYVDYNFSTMTDTKGGFLSTEDDPWNKSMSTGAASGAPGASGAEQKPAHMTAAEWERLQLIKTLQRNKAGPYEPSLSVLADEKTRKRCRECRTVEIDFVWDEVFGCAVCNTCKEKYPEKYSLLTKTECKEDYLLTDRECLFYRTIRARLTTCCSRAQGRRTTPAPVQTEPTQVALARHDAISTLSS
jgi:DNA-repair protein complementing XP-A cells